MGKRRNTTLQIFHGAVAFKSAATKIGFISGHLSVVMAEAGGGRATGGASRLVSPLFFFARMFARNSVSGCGVGILKVNYYYYHICVIALGC